MRKSMRRSAASPALRRPISACRRSAHRTASATLANSARNPSPVCLTMRPRCAAIPGSITSCRWDHHAAMVASSSVSIRRVYPATSAASTAASLRLVFEGSTRALPLAEP